MILAAVGFATLGAWQVQRLAWKIALIARVDARIHAAPTETPGPAAWPVLGRARDEYRRVQAKGRFLPSRDTYVQAVTSLGAGFWVMTPFRTDRDFIVLINRGFVPAELRGRQMIDPPAGDRTVLGLIRMSEPNGGFLRANAPAADRWHSRDVAEIARRRGLDGAAPYFIDVETSPSADGWPRGGLTVVRFSNNHLVYAITWFGMALGTAWAAARVWRRAPGDEP